MANHVSPYVLMCSTPVSGHIIPMLAIASELVTRGLDVCFVTGSGYRQHVEASGAIFVPVNGYGDFYDLTSWDLDSSWPAGKRHLEGTDCFIHDLVHIFCHSIPSQHDSLQGALQTITDHFPGRPIILMTESLNFGAMPLVFGAPGLRPAAFVVIGLNPMMLGSIDHQPFGDGALPDNSPEGRLRNLAANEIQKKTFAPAQKAYADALTTVGAKVPSGFLLDGLYHLPDRFIQMCSPSVEYVRSDAPGSIRFSGGYPMAPAAEHAQPSQPAWWHEVASETSRKIVFVCQGTVSMNLDHLVFPTLAALQARSDVLIIVSAGRRGATLSDHVAIPPNCRVTDYIPYDDVLPHCDVFVTTGGYGAFQRAIKSGIPLVIAAATEEKPETAARAEWAGVAVNLRTGTPSVEQLRQAIDTVLSNAKYKTRALELQREAAMGDPIGVIAQTIEELAAMSLTRKELGI